MNVGIYINLSDPDKQPIKYEQTRAAYIRIFRKINQSGHKAVFLRGSDWYQGDADFSRYWELQNDEFISIEQPISIDVLFDRGRFDGNFLGPRLNPAELNQLFQDKFKLSELLSEFHIQSILVNSAEELSNELDKYADSLATVKYLDSSHGKGVFIGEPSTLLEQEYSFPAVVQEFIDSSKGIPGLVDGRHDLRLIMIDGEIVSGLIRTPPTGGLKSNIGFGGRAFAVTPKKIPDELSQKAIEIDKTFFSNFENRLYSLDFIRNSAGNWLIIEGNEDPTLRIGSENIENYYLYPDRVAEKLISMANMIT